MAILGSSEKRRSFLKRLGGVATCAVLPTRGAEPALVAREEQCSPCYPSYDTEMSWPVELDDERRWLLASYTSRNYFVDRLRGLQPTHRYVCGETSIDRWRQDLRQQLRLRLCIDKQMPSPLAPRILDTKQTDDGRIETLVFQSEAGVWVPALFHIPNGFKRPGPVLVNCVGHGTGISDPLYAYIPDFVKRGFAVFTPQVRDFGDRAFARTGTMSCDRTTKLAGMLGRTVAGLRLWDAMRSIDYLETRPEVDPERIGCGGLSLGGELSMLLAALDDRIKVAFISGFLCTYDGLMFKTNNCICYVIPGVMELCDMSDIAGLIAPRPCVVQSGKNDGAVPFKHATQAFKELKAIYSDVGASERVIHDSFEGRHEFHGAKTFEAFQRWL